LVQAWRLCGIASTLPFNRLNWTFDRNVYEIVVDNFRVSAVPEPPAPPMLALGVPGVLLLKRRRTAKLAGRQKTAQQALVCWLVGATLALALAARWFACS
jgi:hypothetical protein